MLAGDLQRKALGRSAVGFGESGGKPGAVIREQPPAQQHGGLDVKM